MHVTQYRAEYRRHRRSQPGRRGLAASTSEERRCRSLLYSVSPLFPSFPSLVEIVENGSSRYLCERGRRHGGWKKREPNP